MGTNRDVMSSKLLKLFLNKYFLWPKKVCFWKKERHIIPSSAYGIWPGDEGSMMFIVTIFPFSHS